MKICSGGITAPRGFIAAGVSAQIKNGTKKDVGMIYSQAKCSAAGVYTSNLVRAACIDLNRKHLADGQAQALVVNSGNANACTGLQGKLDAKAMADYTAEQLGIASESVIVASTGVIGVKMPMDKVKKGIVSAANSLSMKGAADFAAAIMTTDLVVKEIAVEIELQGKAVYIGATAKGSGMIHPNMATMLAFITTDAAISPECLKKMLKDSVDVSYNMISVDRDTSTNDMAVVLANGKAGNIIIDNPESPEYLTVKAALDFINITLAKAIAGDGEGATHLLEVRVINAPFYQTARRIARSVTESNLTKAAIFGADANWGRILAAAGYSGADFNPEEVDIYIGDTKVAENGMGLVFDETAASAALKQDTVIIVIDMKNGEYEATAWGCDLTYDYVKINADYRS